MSEVHREHAYAKLTRSLRVVGRRADGFHLLEAEMVSLDLADELVFSPAARAAIEVVDEIGWLPTSSPPAALEVPADGTNLVLRALALVGRAVGVRLIKHIPPGAGLGGGSADAAAALRYAGVSDRALALRLGADVPFCLVGGRAAVSGVGEVVMPLAHLEQTFVVLSPALVVETPRVYAAFDELGPGPRASDGLPNDLERAALAVEPRLAAFRALLAEQSGQRPQLAGSGASYFVECDVAAARELGARLARQLVLRDVRALISVTRAVPAFGRGD